MQRGRAQGKSHGAGGRARLDPAGGAGVPLGMEPKPSRRRRIARALEAVAWGVMLAIVAYRLGPQLGAALDVGGATDAAPAFEVTSLDGERFDMESLRGQVVLVHFWATWCRPCRVERPMIERVWRDRRGDGFVVLSLATDRSESDVRDFVADREVSYPVALATPQIVRGFGGIRGTPTSFLIDREGRVRHRVHGIFTEPALRMAVGRLLGE
jgi:cytochrome c biogenesis protein CcmG, thiol:disulfide interchange protein DsbE